MRSRFGKIICQALKAGFAALCFSSPLQTYMGGKSIRKEKLGRTYLIWYKCQPKKEKILSIFTVRSLGHTRLLLGDRHAICFCKWSGIIFVLILNEYLWFRAAFWIYVYGTSPLQYASRICFAIPWCARLCDLVIFHLACFIAVNFTRENRFPESCDRSSCQVV